MNPWLLVFLGGGADDDLVIICGYASEELAQAGLVNTLAPYNYQVCQAFGTAVPTPPAFGRPYASVDVGVGAWLAVCAGTSPSGGLRFYAYGTFADKPSAVAWVRSLPPGLQSGFSFGSARAAA